MVGNRWSSSGQWQGRSAFTSRWKLPRYDFQNSGVCPVSAFSNPPPTISCRHALKFHSYLPIRHLTKQGSGTTSIVSTQPQCERKPQVKTHRNQGNLILRLKCGPLWPSQMSAGVQNTYWVCFLTNHLRDPWRVPFRSHENRTHLMICKCRGYKLTTTIRRATKRFSTPDELNEKLQDS